MKKVTIYCSSILILIVMTGCMYLKPNEGDTIRPLASALTHVSPQVENVIRYGKPPANATDEEIGRAHV